MQLCVEADRNVTNEVRIRPSSGVENRSPLTPTTQTGTPIIISNVTLRSHHRNPKYRLL